MRIAVSTDMRTHLVDILLDELKERGYEFNYFGPEEEGAEADWPDVTLEAVNQVTQNEADEAIVMCWTGTGCSIVANKIPGIRAALCADAATARGARIWNHANVLALSLRSTSESVLDEILDNWFNTPFSDDEWNLKQMARIKAIEDGAS